MNQVQRRMKRLRGLVEEYARCKVSVSWDGTMDKDEREFAAEELDSAQKALNAEIKLLGDVLDDLFVDRGYDLNDLIKELRNDLAKTNA